MSDPTDLIDRGDHALQQRRFLEAVARVPKFPRLGLKQAECLLALGVEPMRGVRAASGRSFRAPNSCVGILIKHAWAIHVPPPEAGGIPSYEITNAGRLLLSWMMAEPELSRFFSTTTTKGEHDA